MGNENTINFPDEPIKKYEKQIWEEDNKFFLSIFFSLLLVDFVSNQEIICYNVYSSLSRYNEGSLKTKMVWG